MPALLTRMSTPPNASIVAATGRSSSSGRARSHGTARPCDSSPTSASRRSARRAVTVTAAPAASSTRANRAPRPELAPVTIATLPSRRNDPTGSSSPPGFMRRLYPSVREAPSGVPRRWDYAWVVPQRPRLGFRADDPPPIALGVLAAAALIVCTPLVGWRRWRAWRRSSARTSSSRRAPTPRRWSRASRVLPLGDPLHVIVLGRSRYAAVAGRP